MAGDISRFDVIDAFSEVVDAMTSFADRIDREVELVVRPDGTASLMGAEEGTAAGEPATGFEEIEAFDSFADLWAFLQLGEPAAAAAVEEEEAVCAE